MHRYFIHFAFRGTAYCGWQLQPNANTVQNELNKALMTLLREPLETVGCGRTDTGVHAAYFVAHFDFAADLDVQWLRAKLNHVLPHDIAVFSVDPVAHDLHARFSAVSRTYTYHLHHQKHPFREGLSVLTHYTLALDTMNKACQLLIETTDFGAFCKAGSDVKNHRCQVSECKWSTERAGTVFTITADRFLRNMVRSIVGTMIDLGRGKLTLTDFSHIVASQKRTEAGTSAPAHGLYLTNVMYPNAVSLNLSNADLPFHP
jgi:tRNA pseudouridine38-40 synthase